MRSIYAEYCVLAFGDEVLICTEPTHMYTDLRDVSSGFVTGWQNYDGQSGQWYSWKNITRVPRTHTSQTEPIQQVHLTALASSHTQDEFIAHVKSMIDDMKRGEYFLANLTRHCSYQSIDLEASAIASCIYHDTPFRYLHISPTQSVLGLSPERFISINSGVITSEPMKGTHSNADALLADEKEHEENTMMIDLVRSDLSKICIPGSIRVDSRDDITAHPGLVQMSSKVSGKLLGEHPITQEICSLMPIASVTGTPKPYVVKKMDVYEKSSRRIYCGAYGYVDCDADKAELAVAIRTLDNTPERLHIGTGAGITVRSDAQAEYAETELKLERLVRVASRGRYATGNDVFTSLRLNNKTAFALKLHCERVARHAHSLGIAISADDLEQSAREHISDHEFFDEEYLRIVIAQETPEFDFTPLTQYSSSAVSGIAFVPHIIHDDYPKYGNRSLYNNALADAQVCSTLDIDEAILINAHGITETTRANVFIRVGSSVTTPPVTSIVRGVLRELAIQDLPRSFTLAENTISLDELLAADEVVITNSVRGARNITRIIHTPLAIDHTFRAKGNLLRDEIQSIFMLNFS